MLAAGLGPIGPIELVIILAIVIAIFGVGKLAGIGSAMGQTIREFRTAAREINQTDKPAPSTKDVSSSESSTDATCTKCGAQLEATVKFCSGCGTAVATQVE